MENYKIVRRDRCTGTSGGGCLVYVATHICIQRMSSMEREQIEGIWLKLLVGSSAFIVGTIYRPPEIYSFFEPFHETIEKLWMKYKNVIIVGDFNCDFSKRQGDNILSVMGQRLQKTLLQFSYTVMNKEPTRVTGDSSTLIDLVIASKETLIRNTRTLELGISDHRLIYGCLCTRIKRPPPKIVKGRTFKNFNRFEFIRDVENAPWSVCSVFDDPDDN